MEKAGTVHVPILLPTIVESLLEPLRKIQDPNAIGWIVDCTLGGGGHTSGFLTALAQDPQLKRHKVLSIDQDKAAIEAAKVRFEREIADGRLELCHDKFANCLFNLKSNHPSHKVYGILADLGFSSDQIEDGSRGLSFLKEGPLDMRLDPSQGFSCYNFLNQVAEKDLADIIFEFGEERFSRRIAHAVVMRRRESGVPNSTLALAELVKKAVPSIAQHGRLHPATRTFQALRIHVNQELEQLDSLLKHGILSVETGGRVAILSFHSLEDKRVKLAFHRAKGKSLLNSKVGSEPVFCSLTKKPIEPSEEEVIRNPRSRSAKLRVAERLR